MIPTSPAQNAEIQDAEVIEQTPQDPWSLGKLYDAYRAVVDLKAGTKKWPFKLAWQVDDLTELFKPYAIKFETRQQGLLAQFAKPADAQSTQPGEFAFTLLQPEEYRVALQELTSTIPTEFKPEKIKPISVSELETVATLEVSSEAIRILRYLGLVTS